jgi:tetratricopeptide (TPR) repeat protein
MRSKILSVCVLALVMLISACGGGKVKPATEPTQKNPASVKKAGALSESEKVEFQQALESIKTNNLPNAEKILKKLSDKLGASTSISANLALTYYKLQRYDLAETQINNALAVNEADAETQNIAGLIAIEMKKHQAAENHFKRALTLKPDFANAHYNIALLYDIYFQDIPNAYSHYQKYLSLVGDSDKETKEWVDQLQYSLKQ